MKIAEKEHEKTISDKKNKLVAGTKEILVLFEEANGLWINLQGKDRKEQIEKYKSICENEGKEYSCRDLEKTHGRAGSSLQENKCGAVTEIL